MSGDHRILTDEDFKALDELRKAFEKYVEMLKEATSLTKYAAQVKEKINPRLLRAILLVYDSVIRQKAHLNKIDPKTIDALKGLIKEVIYSLENWTSKKPLYLVLSELEDVLPAERYAEHKGFSKLF